MLSDTDIRELKESSALRVPQVVWGALMFSVVVYVAVAYLVPPEAEAELQSSIRWVIMGMAALSAIISISVPHFFMSTKKIDEMRKKDSKPMDYAGLYFTTTVVRLAMAESVSVDGLILSFLSGEPSKILPFAAVSFALLALGFPNFGDLQNRTSRMR